MKVKHNPSFVPRTPDEKFTEEGNRDLRWWFNRIYPLIKKRGQVDVSEIRIEGVTTQEVEDAIREGVSLGMWYVLD
jgi:hypothetical protein